MLQEESHDNQSKTNMPTAILTLTSAAMPAASIHTYDGEISSISVS